jgi:enterobacterial common antigen flippase
VSSPVIQPESFAELSSNPNSSYGQILRSSSVIGGAQGINYLIAMVRTKVVAVLLGPSGVGLVGLYVSATSLVGAFTAFGIATSGVREVAEAHSSGDSERVARTVKTLRRVCWVTGVLGWLLTIALAYPLSVWTFGSGARALPVAILGATLLLTSVSGGQTALLQGMRRINDLARLEVISVLVSTLVALALYTWLGEKGIVPVLIVTALITLAFSWWFARRLEVDAVSMRWAETWQHSRRLVSLGAAFMWSGLLTSLVALLLRAIIVRDLGLDANGIYQAAWGVSGMFAGFILGAMATDFYPRLTAFANDHAHLNRLVNEQTEIGILLALPGLLATLGFSTLVMKIFYSTKFLPGADLLPWFVLGIFGQVVSWPMGFALAAKGASAWYVTVETISNVLRLTLSILFLKWLGLQGTALAIPVLYVVHTALLVFICRRLSGFQWTSGSLKLMIASATLILMAFAMKTWLPPYPALAAAAVLTLAASILSLRGMVHRLGGDHRLVKLACRIPGVAFACGI